MRELIERLEENVSGVSDIKRHMEIGRKAGKSTADRISKRNDNPEIEKMELSSENDDLQYVLENYTMELKSVARVLDNYATSVDIGKDKRSTVALGDLIGLTYAIAYKLAEMDGVNGTNFTDKLKVNTKFRGLSRIDLSSA